jgi:HK97 gp10 family phage protein
MASFNKFSQIADAIGPFLSLVVRKTAFDIQAGYQANAPVDTGFMKNSCYVVTSDSSNYGSEADPKVKITKKGTPYKDPPHLLPPVDAPEDDFTAYVAVAANYAIYVEMGTRYMAAQPAFFPAVDAVTPSFEAALSALGDYLEGIAG